MTNGAGIDHVHNLWGVGLRVWKGEWEGKFRRTEVALPEKEGWIKNDF